MDRNYLYEQEPAGEYRRTHPLTPLSPLEFQRLTPLEAP